MKIHFIWTFWIEEKLTPVDEIHVLLTNAQYTRSVADYHLFNYLCCNVIPSYLATIKLASNMVLYTIADWACCKVMSLFPWHLQIISTLVYSFAPSTLLYVCSVSIDIMLTIKQTSLCWSTLVSNKSDAASIVLDSC